jgi:hypothetical protein
MDDALARDKPAPTPAPAADMHPQGGPAEHHGPGHEISDVSVRGIFVFTACLAAFAVAFHFVFLAVMQRFGDRANRLESLRPARYEDQAGQFPKPNLQESPNAEWTSMRIEEQADVTGYGWVDRDAHVARIPLDRAMDLYAAEQGWPDSAAISRSPNAARPKDARPKGEDQPAAHPKGEGQTKQEPESK